jgi:hypothetical protein
MEERERERSQAASAREEMRSDHRKHFAFQFTRMLLFEVIDCRSLERRRAAVEEDEEEEEEATNHKTIFFLRSFDVLFFSRSLASCYGGISFNQLHPMYATTI